MHRKCKAVSMTVPSVARIREGEYCGPVNVAILEHDGSLQ